jgi:hypothetical protein
MQRFFFQSESLPMPCAQAAPHQLKLRNKNKKAICFPAAFSHNTSQIKKNFP